MTCTVVCCIGIGVAAFVILGIGWMWYMGLLRRVNVEVKEIPEMTIINMNYTGSMKDCAKGCTDMERRCEELLHGMPILPTMGSAYYTTPSEVENPEDNRWSVFFVLDDNKELLERAKQLPPSDEYSVVTIPRMKAIYTTFPHRNNSSFFFGPMKVYPPFTKLMNKAQLSPVGCIELYHYNKDPIEYMMFLEHKEVFDELQKTKFIAANLL